MDVTTEYAQIGDHTVVILSGKVDIFSVSPLRKELTDHINDGSHSVAFDLRGLSYMDSSGIGLLAAMQRKCKAIGADFSLVTVPPDILNVLRVCDLDKFFHIVNKLEDLDAQ